MIIVMVQINEAFVHLYPNFLRMTTTAIIPEVSAEKVFTYNEFRQLVSKLLEEGKITGHEQIESYLDYTRLNDHRMNRWDKHFQPSEEVVHAVNSIHQPRTWLLITEGWCGDSSQTAPAIAKIASLNPLINFRVVLRDDNKELMDMFLTNGTRSIPILVCFDEKRRVLWHWGPRPQGARDYITRAKSEGVEIDVLKEKLHLWYAQNKQQDLQRELIACIESESMGS